MCATYKQGRASPCLVGIGGFDSYFKHRRGCMAVNQDILGDRCQVGSKVLPDAVNSPEQRKAKNPRQQAARNMMLYSWEFWISTVSMVCKMYGVIGRQCLSLHDRRCFTPFSTSSNCTVSFIGSLCPVVKCRCLTAEMYDWIVENSIDVEKVLLCTGSLCVLWMG